MPFWRLKSIFRSLRFRLTAWNTTVVVLIVVGTLLGVREALRFTLYHEIDQVLREDALEIDYAVKQMYPDMQAISAELKRKTEGHVQRGMFVELRDDADREIWPSQLNVSQPDFQSNIRNNTVIIAGQRYRLVKRIIDLPKPDQPSFTLWVGSSMAGPDEDIAKVTRVITVVGVLIMFIAPLGGFWLAGRATHPIAQIIHTAERLRPRRMEERLPSRGTGDELDQLSTTINRFLDLIADYLDRNREFVANAAHELRSPLAAIQSSVEVTLNSDRTIGAYKELLAEIVDECSSLGALVNQLLLLAESDAGGVPIDAKRVALDALTQHSVDMFRGAAEERGVELRFGHTDRLTVLGDGRRLQQVVNNLIDNAVKFTPADGNVTVDLIYDRETHEAVFRVSDSGVGISPLDLPHVFERFYRGDKSRQREHQAGGTGLGLSICHSIVQAHGGRIEIESIPTHGPTLGGTTVTVRLPVAASDSVPNAKSFSAAAPSV